MKSLVTPLLLGLLVLAPAIATEPGKKAPAFALKDAGGKQHSSSTYKGKVVVLLVWSSSCPTSKAYGARLEQLGKRWSKGKKVVLLGLAPSRGETAATIKAGKAKGKISFPVLLDGGGKIAKTLGAKVTPTAYVIDGKGVLRYAGRIDDDPRGKKKSPTQHLLQAVDAVLAGRNPSKTKRFGPGFKIRY